MTDWNGFRVADQLLLPWSPRHTISVRRTASMLDVSIATVCRMIDEGTIKAYKMNPDKTNSPWRVSRDSVMAHIDRIHNENALEKRF